MTPKVRTVLLVVSIVAIAVLVYLLSRGRDAESAVSVGPLRPLGPSRPEPTQPVKILPPSLQHADSVEVCGHGRVPIDGSDAAAILQYVDTVTKDARASWLTTLQNSGDLRARVAGLVLQGAVTRSDPPQPMAEQNRNEVVQLAAGTQDPAVYALALSVCAGAADKDVGSACRQLSLQRWAQLDTDNAVPWLLLAGSARARHDSAAEADAFSHAASAHHLDSYSDSLLAFADAEWPPDVTPLTQAAIAVEAIGVQTAIWLPQFGIASQLCSQDAMRDNAIRRQCNSLAELLTTKGNDLLDLEIGIAIGRRAGWSRERVEALVLEHRALLQAIMEQAPADNTEMWSCDAVKQLNTYMAERARVGELKAARDALERSGATVATMAAKYTRYVDKITHDAGAQPPQTSSEQAK